MKKLGFGVFLFGAGIAYGDHVVGMVTALVGAFFIANWVDRSFAGLLALALFLAGAPAFACVEATGDSQEHEVLARAVCLTAPAEIGTVRVAHDFVMTQHSKKGQHVTALTVQVLPETLVEWDTNPERARAAVSALLQVLEEHTPAAEPVEFRDKKHAPATYKRFVMVLPLMAGGPFPPLITAERGEDGDVLYTGIR